ncbi:hypothetical protein GQ54DRAFT_264618 [Martensiomyces pterosporus]|nr:hypothetical protein GQ54DRAFT_264618 [Martensiomyces pterosporus]
METEWRKTQGKYRIRHRLTESLDSRRKYEVVSREENSKNEATAACAPHRSILVRNFEHTIRKCDAFDDTVAVASTPAQSNVESVLLAAWIQYKTIREHADSDMLLKQIRTNSIALFITELNFAPSSLEYRQRFDQIIHIVNDFTKIGRPITNHVLFGIYLRALNKVGKHRLVFKAIPEFCSYANSPGETILLPNILRQLIVAYFGVGRADKAMEAFEMLREDESHKSNLTPHVYTALICGAIRAGHLPDGKILDLVDELLALLCQPKWTGAARTGVLNELLDAVKYSANRALYFSVFDKFASQGISSNYATFGIFLKSLRFLRPNTSQMHGIYRALISHEQSRNAMTRHIFGVFINNFVHTGMISNALAALQDMRDHPTAKPTVLNMSLLFSHYASAGLPEPSLSLYHTMVNADKLAPTWVTYMSIVKAIVKGGNLAAATEIAGMSGAVGGSTEAKAKQFDALLTVLIKTGEVGDFDSMFGAFRKMRVLAPDSLMPFVAVFVRSYFIAKQRARLVRCGPEAATGLGAGVPDDDENRRFVGLLRTCLEDLFGVLARQPAIRDLYNMAISTFATLRDYESTQRAYDHMTKVKHLEPNYRTFNVLIQAYVRNFDLATATNVLQELRDSEVPLNHVTLNVLTRGYVKAGLVDKAIDTYAYMVGRPAPLLESAKFEDFLPCAKPDDYFYAFFISALIDAKRYREAIVVFEDSFAILPFVPRQLLETLVSRLEESSEFDLSLTCLNRYTKRVESCQPTSGQPTASDGKHIASPEPTCDRHPVSYFGYSLDRGPLD